MVGCTGTLTVGTEPSSGLVGAGCPQPASAAKATSPAAYVRGERTRRRRAATHRGYAVGRARRADGSGTGGPFLLPSRASPLCLPDRSGQEQPRGDTRGDDDEPGRHRKGVAEPPRRV